MKRLAIAAVGLALVVGVVAGPGSAAGAPGDTVADRVFGQGGSFASNDCNLGGITANSLCYPNAVAVDGGGNVYVPDNYNNRVLEYTAPSPRTRLPTGSLGRVAASQRPRAT